MKKIYFFVLLGVILGMGRIYAQKGQTQDSGISESSHFDFLVSIPKITEKTFPIFMAEIRELKGIHPQYFCQSNQVFAFQVDVKYWKSRDDVFQRLKANSLNLSVYEKIGKLEDLMDGCQVEVVKIY